MELYGENTLKYLGSGVADKIHLLNTEGNLFSDSTRVF